MYITIHKTLNTIQGIFSRKIINIPQKELLAVFKEQKVVDIHKMLKKGEKLVATGAAIFTFDLQIILKKLRACFHTT